MPAGFLLADLLPVATFHSAAQAKYFPAADSNTIEVSFETTPTAASASITKLPYNKAAALMLEWDDNSLSAITHGKAAMDNLFFTDGTGGNRNWSGTLAINGRRAYNNNEIGLAKEPNRIQYSQMPELISAGWEIANHGWYHDPSGNYNYMNMIPGQTEREHVYYNLKRLNDSLLLRIGYAVSGAVAPSNYKYTGEQAKLLGMLYVTGQADEVFAPYFKVPRYYKPPTQTAAAEYIENIDTSFACFYREFTDAWGSSLVSYKAKVDALLTGNTDKVHKFLRIGTHGVAVGDENAFSQFLQYVAQVANDRLFIGSTRELVEHLRMPGWLAMEQTSRENKLLIKLHPEQVPADVQFKKISLLVNSNAVISSVKYNGVSMPFNAQTGLVNIDLTVHPPVAEDGTVNKIPVAVIDSHPGIQLPQDSTVLNASASYDEDGYIAHYHWENVEGPVVAQIDSPFAAVTNVRGLTIAGDYRFRLSVKDDKDDSAEAFLLVKVNPAEIVVVDTPQTIPVAYIAAVDTVKLPADSVWLDGTASCCADSSALTYEWEQTGGPVPASILSPHSGSSQVKGLSLPGLFFFKLTVWNTRLDSASAFVCVVVDSTGVPADTTAPVTDTPDPGIDSSASHPPKAVILVADTLQLPLEDIWLEAARFEEPAGTPFLYRWQQTGGPASLHLLQPDSSKTRVAAITLPGDYCFMLTVANAQQDTVSTTACVHIGEANHEIQPPSGDLLIEFAGVPTAASYYISKVPANKAAALLLDWDANSLSALTYGKAAMDSLSYTDGVGSRRNWTASLAVNGRRGWSNAEIGLAKEANMIQYAQMTPLIDAGWDIANNGWYQEPTGKYNYNNMIPGQSEAERVYNNITRLNDSLFIRIGYRPAMVVGQSNCPYTGEQAKAAGMFGITGQADEVFAPALKVPRSNVAGKYQAMAALVENLDTGFASIYREFVYNWTTALPGIKIKIDTLLKGNTTDRHKFLRIGTTMPAETDSAAFRQFMDYVKTKGGDQLFVGSARELVENLRMPGWLKPAAVGQEKYLAISLYPENIPAVVRYRRATLVVQADVPIKSVSYRGQPVAFDAATGQINLDFTATPVAGNRPPVALPKKEMTIYAPVDSIPLADSASFDPEGKTLRYAWTQTAGPATAIIDSPAAAVTMVRNLNATGVYQFSLRVTDPEGLFAAAVTRVEVLSRPNRPPVANAGAAQVIYMPASSVTVNGALSSDPDNDPLQYEWLQVAGPATASIVQPAEAATAINGLAVAGAYTFRLTVKDAQLAVSTADVTITVLPAGNILPVADAGEDQVVQLPQRTTSFSAAASYDPDGTVKAYLWSKLSGPSVYLYDTWKAVVRLENLNAGAYVLLLKITDNKGGEAYDTVRLQVLPAGTRRTTPAAGDAIAATQLAAESFAYAFDAKLYPVPVYDAGAVLLTGSYKGRLQVTLYDYTGRLQLGQVWEKQLPRQIYTMTMNKLPAGSYVLVIKGKDIYRKMVFTKL
ncbi:MAG: hypothetical protein QM664_11825 [Flavihumibacter sp.]